METRRGEKQASTHCSTERVGDEVEADWMYGPSADAWDRTARLVSHVAGCVTGNPFLRTHVSDRKLTIEIRFNVRYV